MKFLLTGADGQVGQELDVLLKNTSHQVIALNKQSLDITNLHQIEHQLEKHSPDWVINAAAYTAVDEAEKEIQQCFSVNAHAVENLAYLTGIRKIPILHLSTDYVFSGEKNNPYTETDTAHPKTIYGQSKLAGEKLLAKKNLQHIILRTSWVFGNYGNNFFKKIQQLLSDGNQVKVVDDQIGGPTWSYDLARAIIHICSSTHNTKWGTYHYSGEPYVSWYEFAQCIAGSRREDENHTEISPIKSEASSAKAPRPKNSRLSNQKIFQTFGISASDWHKAINICTNEN